MKSKNYCKNLGIPINQEEVYYYLKDIRKIKVMSPEREKTLAIKMKSDNISEIEKAVETGIMKPLIPIRSRDLKNAALEAEYDAILTVLREVNFNKTKAAKILNIDRKTLYNKIKAISLGK